MVIVSKSTYFTHKRRRKKKVKEIIKNAFQGNPNSDGNLIAYLDDFIDDNIEFNSKGRTIKPLYAKKIIRKFLNSFLKG